MRSVEILTQCSEYQIVLKKNTSKGLSDKICVSVFLNKYSKKFNKFLPYLSLGLIRNSNGITGTDLEFWKNKGTGFYVVSSSYVSQKYDFYQDAINDLINYKNKKYNFNLPLLDYVF